MKDALQRMENYDNINTTSASNNNNYHHDHQHDHHNFNVQTPSYQKNIIILIKEITQNSEREFSLSDSFS